MLAAVRTSGYHVPGGVADSLRVLSPWQYVVVSAVGKRLTASEGVDVAGFTDQYLVDLADSDRTDLLRFVA